MADRQAHQQLVESEIVKCLGELFPQGEGTANRHRVEHGIRRIAKRAFTEGENYALSSLMTVRDIAQQLHVSERRVRAIARERHESLHIGWQVPGTSTWLFRPEEVELLRPGTSGRPRKD